MKGLLLPLFRAFTLFLCGHKNEKVSVSSERPKESWAILATYEDTSVSLEGYSLTSTIKYPRSVFYISWLLRLLTAYGLYFLASWGFIGGGIYRGLIRTGKVEASILFVLLSTELARGLIQRIIGRLLGYEISFYPLLFLSPIASFAITPGQFQSRREALLIAIGPLSLFVLILIVLLFQPLSTTIDILEFVISVNLSGAVWDIYFIYKLVLISGGAVLHTKSIMCLLIFEPISRNT